MQNNCANKIHFLSIATQVDESNKFVSSPTSLFFISNNLITSFRICVEIRVRGFLLSRKKRKKAESRLEIRKKQNLKPKKI